MSHAGGGHIVLNEAHKFLSQDSDRAPRPGWRDLEGPIVVRTTGANRPVLTQMGSAGMETYAWVLNDKANLYFHLPHDFYRPDGGHTHKVFPHVHWTQSGSNSTTVKWQFRYFYAHGHQQGDVFDIAGNGTVVTAESSGQGTAWQHMVTEVSEGNGIDASAWEPDGFLLVQLTRITNGGTDNTDTIFAWTCDIHYQSEGIATPYRSPNFYRR